MEIRIPTKNRIVHYKSSTSSILINSVSLSWKEYMNIGGKWDLEKKWACKTLIFYMILILTCSIFMHWNLTGSITIHAATCTSLTIGIMSNFLNMKYINVCLLPLSNISHPISSNLNLCSWLHSCWRDNRTMARSCDKEFIRIHITKQYKKTIRDLIYISMF